MTLTFYDIGAEDHQLEATLKDDGEIEIKVFNEEEEEVYREKGHRFAWEAYVRFAEQILQYDQHIKTLQERAKK